MTDTLAEHADPRLHSGEPLIDMKNVGKTYGAIRALKGINLTVRAGEVTCVLGDNGAGKSTLIKIMAGLHPHNEGTMKVDGKEVSFGSPRESLDHGIATVYQDLAVVSLMEVWRNFFLGSELTSGKGPFATLKIVIGSGSKSNEKLPMRTRSPGLLRLKTMSGRSLSRHMTMAVASMTVSRSDRTWSYDRLE